MEVNPLSIILVKSDSKGDRLLFRYPFTIKSNESNQKKKRHPYSLVTQEDILQSPLPQTSNIHQGIINQGWCIFCNLIKKIVFCRPIIRVHRWGTLNAVCCQTRTVQPEIRIEGRKPTSAVVFLHPIHTEISSINRWTMFDLWPTRRTCNRFW